jgi:hypothetical protein
MGWPRYSIAPANDFVPGWGGVPLGRLLLMGVLVASGCNVLDGRAPAPKSLDALLADARTALRADHPSRAVRVLERALQKDTTDVRVRVELGAALYAERGLDVFMVRAAMNHLAQDDSTSSPSLQASRRVVCTDGAQPAAAPGRYSSVAIAGDPLRALIRREAVVERVRRLVVAGVLERRATAFSGARPSLRRKGRLIGATTVAVRALLYLSERVRAAGGTLFRDREAGSIPALVACAETATALASCRGALCTLGRALRRGQEWLRTRDRLSGRKTDAKLTKAFGETAAAATTRANCP